MKCPYCNSENKPESKFCKKCGKSLIVRPVWQPSWVWHLKVLTIIYVILILIFFLLNYLLKPFMRQVPKEITPWLQKK